MTYRNADLPRRPFFNLNSKTFIHHVIIVQIPSRPSPVFSGVQSDAPVLSSFSIVLTMYMPSPLNLPF